MEPLTPQARRVLSQLKVKLVPGQRVKKKLTPVWQVIFAWADERALISPTDNNGQHLYISYALLQQIEKHLHLEGEASLDTSLAQSSLTQAQTGATEYKGPRVAPRHQRVLIALPCNTSAEPWSQNNWVYRDIDFTLLAPGCCSYLVVVENLDCFYQLNKFQLPLPEDALIIYRGDRLYGKGLKQLRAQAWVKELPNYYFGDLDPAGLRIAKHENYDHVAVSNFAWFTQFAHSADYTAGQHQFLAGLTRMGALQPYVDFMAMTQRAVKQQKLQGIPLSWLALDT